MICACVTDTVSSLSLMQQPCSGKCNARHAPGTNMNSSACAQLHELSSQIIGQAPPLSFVSLSSSNRTALAQGWAAPAPLQPAPVPQPEASQPHSTSSEQPSLPRVASLQALLPPPPQLQQPSGYEQLGMSGNFIFEKRIADLQVCVSCALSTAKLPTLHVAYPGVFLSFCSVGLFNRNCMYL